MHETEELFDELARQMVELKDGIADPKTKHDAANVLSSIHAVRHLVLQQMMRQLGLDKAA